MKKNFVVLDYISIKLGDEIYDLHNDYGFVGIEYDEYPCQCTLIWRKYTSGKNRISIKFSGLSRISMYMEAVSAVLSGKEMSFIGYLPPEEFGNHHNFIPEENSEPHHHIVFCFEDNSYAIIDALTANAQIL